MTTNTILLMSTLRPRRLSNLFKVNTARDSQSWLGTWEPGPEAVSFLTMLKTQGQETQGQNTTSRHPQTLIPNLPCGPSNSSKMPVAWIITSSEIESFSLSVSLSLALLTTWKDRVLLLTWL